MLHLSDKLLNCLKVWSESPVCDSASGLDPLPGQIVTEEAELAKKVYEDFARFKSEKKR